LEHTPKSKKKVFCDDKCRYTWWNAHRSGEEALKRDARAV
jgi:hypothetical protein